MCLREILCKDIVLVLVVVEAVASFCEEGNDLSGYIKQEKFSTS
jgi:hypothetical protein